MHLMCLTNEPFGTVWQLKHFSKNISLFYGGRSGVMHPSFSLIACILGALFSKIYSATKHIVLRCNNDIFRPCLKWPNWLFSCSKTPCQRMLLDTCLCQAKHGIKYPRKCTIFCVKKFLQHKCMTKIFVFYCVAGLSNTLSLLVTSTVRENLTRCECAKSKNISSLSG